MANTQEFVAEFQGLYGPFTIAERVLQKIWLRGDFNLNGATLVDGRRLEVVSAGDWNLLGGPDFHCARLRIDGREAMGDVEVHFHASDWTSHGHSANPAYANVVLHVVLFQPGKPVAGLPTLVLLPLLHRGLEEYAADDALETLTERDEWRRFAELAAKPKGELLQLLCEKANGRWRQKVRFAQLRIEKLAWDAACHQTALEILGYRHNRTAMLAIATRHLLEEWRAGLEPETLFEEGRALWRLHGVRPANHPRTRLRQYAAWTRKCPDWPGRLSAFMDGLNLGASSNDSTRTFRDSHKLADLRELIAGEVIGSSLGGTRLDTLICDGLLPLVAAKSAQDLSRLWFHWYVGDVPDQVRRGLGKLGVSGGKERPHCHGWGQGLLGWLLSEQLRASA